MKVFRQVSGLWIAPDFSAVECGECAPPYVNHDEVDFIQLADFLQDHFSCAERVRLRLPDDTVDQVTVHHREGTAIQCRDFAQLLLEATPGARSPVPIRKKWRALHALPDRTKAPPPVLLLFVVEGTFEAVKLWSRQAAMRLQIRAADATLGLSQELTPDDYQGQLGPPLARQLASAFNTPYKPWCMLDCLVWTKEPDWAR